MSSSSNHDFQPPRKRKRYYNGKDFERCESPGSKPNPPAAEKFELSSDEESSDSDFPDPKKLLDHIIASLEKKPTEKNVVRGRLIMEDEHLNSQYRVAGPYPQTRFYMKLGVGPNNKQRVLLINQENGVAAGWVHDADKQKIMSLLNGGRFIIGHVAAEPVVANVDWKFNVKWEALPHHVMGEIRNHGGL